MAGPHPAVAQVRQAVRGCLSARGSEPRGSEYSGFEPGDLVLAACSGGGDSLALAAALAFEAPRLGLRAGGVTVDHGLQPGSAQQAQAAVAAMAKLGLDPVQSIGVVVPRAGTPGYPGPEAAARTARYQALERAAGETGAVAILLAHTSDDQAESVLLGLARGSGTRSLAGMPERSGRCLRPLLGISRAQTQAACAAQNLQPWDDPQNADPAFARARVRHRLMPALEAELGPGVAQALARTARQLRADADYLDSQAKIATERMSTGEPGLPLDVVAALPEAIRSRVLRDAAVAAGCPAGGLTARHVAALDALVTGWHGQRWTDLPGGVRGLRRYGRLLLRKDRRDEGDAGGPGDEPRWEGTSGRG